MQNHHHFHYVVNFGLFFFKKSNIFCPKSFDNISDVVFPNVFEIYCSLKDSLEPTFEILIFLSTKSLNSNSFSFSSFSFLTGRIAYLPGS